MPRLWLLDRDGVLNEQVENGYVLSWGQWRTLDGVAQALAMMRTPGARVAVVTNQACIGKGLTSLPQIDELHARFNADLQEHGAHIDRFYICPHRVEDGCRCRKPEPGLILKALAEFRVTRADTVLIGDSDSDMLAAARAGVPGIRVQGDGALLRVVQAISDGEERV